jgi:hypothetical protein
LGFPTIQGKLAQEIVKDTYDFGFVTLPEGYDDMQGREPDGSAVGISRN